MTEPIDLEELIAQIRAAWEVRYSRGRILHVHRNALRLSTGNTIHLRVMVQQIADNDPAFHGEDCLTHAEP